MKHQAVLLLFCLMALTMQTISGASVLNVDLMEATSSLPANMTWHSALTSGSGNCACDRQGVLKLTVPSGMAAEIKLTFSHSTGYTFHVADSSTNNGYSGDGNTQKNDAEVHSVGNTIYFYGRDNPAGGSYGLLLNQSNFVAINPYTTVTLNIADELATADNGQQFLYINSHKMFALNGQSDSSFGGVNYDLYLGLNRVVLNSHRSGTGLCKVSVKFVAL